MTKAIVSPDQDAIVCEIDIAAPGERVFAAIADAEVVRRPRSVSRRLRDGSAGLSALEQESRSR